MEEPRVRIRDIADELGLSTATVSNVLHGKTHKVSDATVQRVLALVEEREYIPSMAGILLARNSSRIIGVVINDHEKYEGHTLEDSFVASALNCLSTELEAAGLFMMVKKTTQPEEILRFASMWNLDGLVLMGFCDQDYVYLRSHMRIPFVVYDGWSEDTAGVCNITIDNYSGGFQVGAYFRGGGHKRGLCVTDNLVCLDRARYEGFAAGFGGEGADLMLVPLQKQQRMEYYRSHLDELRAHTAIFVVSDYYAVELMQFLTSQGIRIPGELSIAGFDDTPVCRMVYPTLTSVRQDVAQRARIAVEMLGALKEHRDTPCSVALPVELVLRESTACL